MERRKTITGIALGASVVFLASCGKERSSITGWDYNNTKNGGFEVAYFEEQETGPGLVLIEGGTFVFGRVEQDFLYDWDNIPRRTTVSSFYMDETEVANIHWLEYLWWSNRVFGMDYPEVVKSRLPDTLVWREKLAYNEPYVELYLRHPAYHYYPVVGVSWVQATDFCAWRTDRVNEMILIREGVLRVNPDQVNEDNFNTDAYLAGQYEGLVKDLLYDYNPSGSGTRKVRMEDGILLPRYRLPTEAEWEYAALGLIGNTIFERVTERRLYPWNGHMARNYDEKYKGLFLANFMRGRGDMMGVAGYLNDNADVTSPVLAYWPNDYGLYNMPGNVSEWVMDIYRPLSLEDQDEFRPFRGNELKTQVRDEEGYIAEKDSLGRVNWREVNEKDDNLTSRRNYRVADNRNHLDGDQESDVTYKYGAASMINDEARVYKGGSWRDRQYWLVPGTRRYLDQNQATAHLGFRCAMHRVGSPSGLGTPYGQ